MVMGWSVDQVDDIRRKYVDGAKLIEALGERMANEAVK